MCRNRVLYGVDPGPDDTGVVWRWEVGWHCLKWRQGSRLAVRTGTTVTSGLCHVDFPIGRERWDEKKNDLLHFRWVAFRSGLRKYSFTLNLNLDLLMFALCEAPVPQREEGYGVCLHLRAEDLGQWRMVHVWRQCTCMWDGGVMTHAWSQWACVWSSLFFPLAGPSC